MGDLVGNRPKGRYAYSFSTKLRYNQSHSRKVHGLSTLDNRYVRFAASLIPLCCTAILSPPALPQLCYLWFPMEVHPTAPSHCTVTLLGRFWQGEIFLSFVLNMGWLHFVLSAASLCEVCSLGMVLVPMLRRAPAFCSRACWRLTCSPASTR